MDLIGEIKEKLSIFKNLYDALRIIDPLSNEKIIAEDDKIKRVRCTCYGHWKRNNSCPNCVSKKAYMNNDTFVKIEYDEEKVVLITATPVEIKGKVYIVDMLKDITNNSSIVHKINGRTSISEETICEMNEKIIKDELTGVYNRRYINERLPIDIDSSIKNKTPLSIIMTDIDFFKVVNDKYGHTIGDKVLTDFTDLIIKSIRSTTDWIGRYGGEEFIIVLNNTDYESAFIVADKIRKMLEETIFQYGDISVDITSSFGVHTINGTEVSMEQFIEKADVNLYKAKNSGKNKIVIS